LPKDIAQQMLEDGWNVKYLKPREEGDVPQAYLPVAVSYKVRSPLVVMISNNGRSRSNLGEAEIDILDWADIVNVDLMLNPYEWAVNGKSGTKAYLESIYVTIEEDELARKYSNIGRDAD